MKAKPGGLTARTGTIGIASHHHADAGDRVVERHALHVDRVAVWWIRVSVAIVVSWFRFRPPHGARTVVFLSVTIAGATALDAWWRLVMAI
jgi:hypothetical protein